MTTLYLPDAAKFLGLHPHTVQERAKAGIIPASKPGRRSNGNGYLLLRLSRRSYYIHRLVWLWFHGEFPTGQIDHINRDRLDNRIENLRDATASQNRANRPAFGVTFEKGRWVAKAGSENRYLGRFRERDDALKAFQSAHAERFGEFSPFHATILGHTKRKIAVSP